MMKKIPILIFAMFLSLGAMAQLEVKPDSFKEVVGFVNINLDIQTDDNDVPYAVVKVKTENINDKQRRELLFQGDAATFIECEYKVGEVWVYITYKASYLKISHPDLSSTEFWFPFDMQPKKGYELTLSNNAKTTDDEILERLKKLEESSKNQPEPQIIYVEKPAEPKDDTPVVQPMPTTPEKPHTQNYSFLIANASLNSYCKPAFGFTIGNMRKAGVFLSLMTNFKVDYLGIEESIEHANSTDIQNIINSNGYNCKTEYSSYSAIIGLIVNIYGPLKMKIGGGYSSNSMIVTLYDDYSNTNYWVSDCSSYGFGGLLGVQAHFGRFVISLDGATTNFKIYEGRIGIGYGILGK